MRLFVPDIKPNDILPKQRRVHGAWFRHGECLRLIYDELRDASQPMTTRELTERIMRIKAIPVDDNRCRELMTKIAPRFTQPREGDDRARRDRRRCQLAAAFPGGAGALPVAA